MYKRRYGLTTTISRRHVVKGLVALPITFGLVACGVAATRSEASTEQLQATATPSPTPAPTFSSVATKEAMATQQASQPITPLFVFKGHTDTVNQVAWTGSTYVASASDDGSVQVWDPFHGAVKLTYHGMNGPVKGVDWSPDGTKIVIAGKTVQIIDIYSGKMLLQFAQNKNVMLAVAWSPDGKYIACTGEDNTAYIWDAATGKIISSSMVGKAGSTATSIAWPIANTPTRIAATANDGTTQTWDALVGKNITTYNVSSVVNTVAWIGDAGTPDANRLLAFACADNTTQVWSAAGATKQLIFTNPGKVLVSAPSPSKSLYIASGLANGSIPVWSYIANTVIGTYTGHSDSVTTIAWSFSPGMVIASGSKDKTVQIWQAPI